MSTTPDARDDLPGRVALTGDPREARPVTPLRPGRVAGFCDSAEPAIGAWIDQAGFTGKAGSVLLLPGADGLAGALFGLGEATDPLVFGALARGLPAGAWRVDEAALAQSGFSTDDLALGWGCGAYEPRPRLSSGPRTGNAHATLAGVDGAVLALDTLAAIVFARDLINAAPNLLGPAELADAAASLAAAHGAVFRRIADDALVTEFPAIAAVGAGSARKPVVAAFSWSGSLASADARLVSLVGKGVVFDTGGYDLKPSAGMLRMKKDMGGAAVVLAIASLVMARDLPLRLEVRIGCVENSVSGSAMRPSDVIATRAGLSVEVSNTDAEGRLVLADLLAEACEGNPDLLIDVATLTGAARVALGPDLPALFTDDDGLADRLVAAGKRAHDPLWRLPIWDGYADWLDTPFADVSNVSAKPMAGAITAALFLRRFVAAGTAWAHLDAYCWNAGGAPGGRRAGTCRRSVRCMSCSRICAQTKYSATASPIDRGREKLDK